MKPDATGDRGNALIELVFGISALLVPIAVGMTAMVEMGSATALAETTVREVARAFVLADDDESALAAADRVARLNFRDAGRPFMRPTITCSIRPCVTPGAHVTIALRFPLDLPWGRWLVRSEHVQVVDPWRTFD